MSKSEAHDRSGKIQEPHVSRHGNRVQMRYDVPHRLNASKVYPLRSHRGSEIIVSGYEDGLHIIWRGGNPLSRQSRVVPTRTAFKEWNGPVSIHSLDEKTDRPKVTSAPEESDKPIFEDEDEELDVDEACLPIVQELKLSLGSPVLHIAVPNLSPAKPSLRSGVAPFDPNVPVVMQVNIVVAVTCVDSSVRIITLPLAPPSASAKRHHTLGAQICQLAHAAPLHHTSRAVALSWTPRSSLDQEHGTGDLPMTLEDQQYDLLVALSGSGVSSTLTFFRIPLPFDPVTGGQLPHSAEPFHTVQLAAPARHVAFNQAPHPSTKSSQLLLVDNKGSLKIYDPLATDSARSRPSSSASSSKSTATPGAWLISFDAPFHIPKDTLVTHAGLARRKSILDACWVMAGRAVFVLLGDGEWGVWRVDSAGPSTNSHSNTVNNFAIGGTLVGDRAETSIASDLKTRSNQRLAPMTPNTRKTRQESLFSAPSSVGAADVPKGGVSVAATTTSHGAPDDSVIIWYGSQIYHIASLTAIGQGGNSRGRDLGSLYGPGLARLENVNVSGEMLNHVAQFPLRNTAANVGSLTNRDVLVTGEYRFVIISTTRPQTPARSLFAGESGSPAPTHDLQLLQKGELDLNGMGRLLDGMAGVERTNGFGNPKRVGFVR